MPHSAETSPTPATASSLGSCLTAAPKYRVPNASKATERRTPLAIQGDVMGQTKPPKHPPATPLRAPQSQFENRHSVIHSVLQGAC